MRPFLTGSLHPLPFELLSPADFERLCYWLVRREGYEAVEHEGASGQDGGCDIVAYRGGQRVVFQCKRTPRLGPKTAEAAVDKILALSEEERPARLVLVVAGSVSTEARRRARLRARPLGVEVWDRTALDERMYRSPEARARFFALGEPGLRLTRYPNRWITDDREVPLEEAAPLLSPYARSIPLAGRESDLEDLQGWLKSGRLISVRVITAAAGAGKTRLALELCEAAVRDGWEAGFLTRIPDAGSSWGWSGPTLAVVDYAASRARLLRGWLIEMSDRPRQEGQPLRLLLLERHADPFSGWWRETFGSGGGDAEAVQALLDPPTGPYVLQPLAGLEARRAVLNAILAKVGSPVQPPEPGVAPDFDRQLDEVSWGGEPLFLLMAGLLAARAGFGAVLALPATELGFRIARHEIERIEKIAESRRLPRLFLAHLAAYVTLCQGFSRERVDAVVEEEREALHYRSAGDSPEIVEALAAALPGGGAIAPVLPDVIGEAVALEALGAGSPEKALAAVSRAARVERSRVIASLIRLAQDFGTVRPEPLAWFERVAEECAGDLTALVTLLDQLPESTLILREQAGALAAKAVELVRETGQRALRALLIRHLSVRLGNLGRHEEALVAAEEATRIVRELAADQPDVFRPHLVTTLHNFSLRLVDLGRSEEGLAAIQQALEILLERAAAQPKDVQPDLALILNNMGVFLGTVGRREDSLNAVRQSSEIFRDLTAANPGVFRPHLARALDNLSLRLVELGRSEEALPAIQQAVEIYRELAASRPDEARPDLARALNSLSVILIELGRREESLAAVHQSVEIYSELATTHPKVFQNELARALNHLSMSLGNLGRREESLAAIRRSAEVYRELVVARPEAFQPALARALNNLSKSLNDLGRQEEALAAIRQAVEIYRELAAALPEAFQPDLARSLINLSKILTDLGRHEEAIVSICHSVEIHRKLVAAMPDAFRPGLALSLINLSMSLRNLGRREEALDAGREAVELHRELAAARPDAFGPNLALSLNNLAILLRDLGRPEDACAATQQALNLYCHLATAWPDAFRPGLAMSFTNLSGILAYLGRREEALLASEQAVEIFRQLAAAYPDAFEPYLAESLGNLALSLNLLGQHEEASLAGQQAVEIYRKLAPGRPDAFRSVLASALTNQSKCLTDSGHREEALAASEQAVEIYRELADAEPAAIRQNLARSLINLSASLNDVGRLKEALEVIEEAVILYRDLAMTWPDAVRPELAMALNNLGVALRNSPGRREEALEASRQAVALYRELATVLPETHEPDLARALNNLAECLSDLDRSKEAAAAIEEATRVLSPFFLAYPTAFQVLMKEVVSHYSQYLQQAGRAPDLELLAPIQASLAGMERSR